MTVDPTMSARLIDQEARYGASHDQPIDLVCTRADGAYLWDVQGARHLDFLGGALALGHNHTRIAAAMVEQCLRLCLAPRPLRNDRLPPLLEKLCRLAGCERALLLNSGAEAVQAAIRTARRWGCRTKGIRPDRAEILAFGGNSHGLASTDPDSGSSGPGWRTVPFGDLATARAAVGPDTCAILVEPVQSDADVPPRGFLRGLRELCDGQRILLIADEIRSGLGRTGKLFAFEHEGVRPDLITLGQALSGGFYPVSALLGSDQLLGAPGPDGPGSGYAGNPLACAVVSAALDVLNDEKLVERSAELGAYLLEQLRALERGRIRDIHGLGLWVAIELRPEAGPAHQVCATLRQEGLLCAEAHEHTLLLQPPLVVTREQLDWALAKLKLVLEG